jgi:hypothetical protein
VLQRASLLHTVSGRRPAHGNNVQRDSQYLDRSRDQPRFPWTKRRTSSTIPFVINLPERSAKPLYVGSTPTRASNNLRADLQTTVFAHARTSSSEFNEDHRHSSKITLIHPGPGGVMAIQSAWSRQQLYSRRITFASHDGMLSARNWISPLAACSRTRGVCPHRLLS